MNVFAAGNRRSPYYVLSGDEIKTVCQEIEAIGADIDDFVFNSEAVRGTCFLARDGKYILKVIFLTMNILNTQGTKCL